MQSSRNFSDAPSWCLFILFVGCALYAYYFGVEVLPQVLPGYFATANKIPLLQSGFKGWLLTSILAFLGLGVWLTAGVAAQCSKILFDRWLK